MLFSLDIFFAHKVGHLDGSESGTLATFYLLVQCESDNSSICLDSFAQVELIWNTGVKIKLGFCEELVSKFGENTVRLRLLG